MTSLCLVGSAGSVDWRSPKNIREHYFENRKLKTLEKLKNAKTLPDIALLLGYKTSGLSYILYKIPDSTKYIEFEIPKKDGDVRVIQAPIDKLKVLQQQQPACFKTALLKSQALSPMAEISFTDLGENILS